MAKKKSTATRRAEQTAAAERAAAIRKEHERKEKRRRTLAIGGAIAAVLTLILVIFTVWQSERDTSGAVGAVPSGVVDQYAIPRGQENAPVTVAIYEDFMCPYCGDFEQASEPMLAEYVESGDVQVEYRAMAFLDDASESRYSTRAMNAFGAVLDAAGPDVAVSFHDLLFENQPEEGTYGLTDDELIAYAVEAGASKDAVSGPIRDVRFEQWVVNANDAASKDGVASTPTIMVNGEVIENEGTIDELLANTEAAIQEGLGS